MAGDPEPRRDSMGERQLKQLDQLIKKSRRLIDELEFLLDEPHGSHKPSDHRQVPREEEMDQQRSD